MPMYPEFSQHVRHIKRSATIAALIDDELSPQAAAAAHRMVTLMPENAAEAKSCASEISQCLLEIDLAHTGTGHKISDPLLALLHFCELCTQPPHIAPEDRVTLLRE